MKKLLSILVLGLLLSGNAYANKLSIQCTGENTPNATFTITNYNIIVSDGFVFELEGASGSTASGQKSFYKKNMFGLKKLDSSWDIFINLKNRTATITTYREWEGGVAKDVYHRYYSGCRW